MTLDTGKKQEEYQAEIEIGFRKQFYLAANLLFILGAFLFHNVLRLNAENWFFKLTYFLSVFLIAGQSVILAVNTKGGGRTGRWLFLRNRIVRVLPLLLASLVIWVAVSQYLLCPRFDFPAARPFSGGTIFNPYDSLEEDNWVKCNFHAHAQAWKGITNGHGTADYLHQLYKAKKYAFHCVSNYHQIDTTYASRSFYIPAYEHGYNILKTHQLVLGSAQVKWLDYVFPQSVHNKQHVINSLGEWGNVLILNHPAIRDGYSAEDLSALTGYNCMEVLNPSRMSEKQWDAALSAGRRVYVAGNDDMHNALKKDRLGRMCTFVNVRDRTGNDVLTGLKAGATFAVRIGEGLNVDSIPTLKKLSVQGDSVTITMSRMALEAVTVTQYGDTIHQFNNTNEIRFLIKPEYHYARSVFHYENGTSVYLNPVCYTPETGYEPPLAHIDWVNTSLFRILGVLLLNFWLVYCRRLAFVSGKHQLRIVT